MCQSGLVSASPAVPPAASAVMPLVIAHRGASADHPENTLAAFEGATHQGADGVELDVRLTRDEQLVLSHDHRLPDGTYIHRATAEALRATAPLEELGAALDVASGIINVEVKSDERAEQFARRLKLIELVLEELGRRPGQRFVLSSFDLDILALLAAWGVPYPTAYLAMVVPRPDLALDAAARMGCSAYNPWYPEVDEGLILRARERGLEVWTWTVNDFDEAVRMCRLGVDAIITDHPAAMREHLADAGFVPGPGVGEPDGPPG